MSKKIFKFKSHTVRYTLSRSYSEVYMNCNSHNGNAFIWTLLLSEVVPEAIMKIDMANDNLLSQYWASTIVGYTISNSAWPATTCVEDCYKLCNELDRVIAMDQEERNNYLTEIIKPVLTQLVIQDF